MPNQRIKCCGCAWRGEVADVLSAPHPFIQDETLVACPECKSISDLVYVCDEPDCWEGQAAGFPSATGYRFVCGRHYRLLRLVKSCV